MVCIIIVRIICNKKIIEPLPGSVSLRCGVNTRGHADGCNLFLNPWVAHTYIYAVGTFADVLGAVAFHGFVGVADDRS